MTNPTSKHGGARPGAGRKPRGPELLPTIAPTNDPLVFLQSVMACPDADIRLRVGAAVALLPFVHAKRGDASKKEQQQDAAKKASGKYATAQPPVRLVR